MGQGALFIWMMLAGMAAGALYMLLALVRRLICAGFYLTLLCDLAFGLGCAVIFIAALTAANYGQVRLFALLGMGLGLALFFLAFSAPLKNLERLFLHLYRRIAAALSKNRLIKVIFK